MPIVGSKRRHRRNRWREKPQQDAMATLAERVAQALKAVGDSMAEVAQVIAGAARAIERLTEIHHPAGGVGSLRVVTKDRPLIDMGLADPEGYDNLSTRLSGALANGGMRITSEIYTAPSDSRWVVFDDPLCDSSSPAPCQSCHYRHGSDGIVCAVHPEGPDGNECGDWQGRDA